ncbi:MAG TPA: glycosyltransferase family 2 protein [Acidimicrobiia bacterium]|nr:glycosyltransferase family 2 protein [Acidimicrobiia bacterium]
MSTATSLLSVVAPVYNEEAGLATFAERLVHVLDQLDSDLAWEVVFVNDGSTDRSIEILRELGLSEPRIKIVDLSRNFGHQLAITAGVDHAVGDAVVIIDSDLQDPPEVIADLVDQWRKGFKVVYGVRSRRSGENRFKLMTAKWFYRLLGRLSDTPLPHDAGDFRLLDRTVVAVLGEMREENRYLRGMVSWVGFPQTSVAYERGPRLAGASKYTLGKMVRFALDGITSFTERPLRLAAQLGFLVTVVAMAWMAWILIDVAIHPDAAIQGWPSLMATILFIGGVQLLTIGILGEYLGRVYRETKGRPLYVVGERINCGDPT